MKYVYYQNIIETICITTAAILIILFITNCEIRKQDSYAKREMYSECLKSTKDCNKWLE